MKKILFLTIAVFMFVLVGCGQDRNIPINEKFTIIIPNVVECAGVVEKEFVPGVSGWFPRLKCEDGRIFHNITNYQVVNELNPLRK